MPLYSKSSQRRKYQIFGLIVAVLLGIGLGLVIGWLVGAHMHRIDERQERVLALSETLIKNGFDDNSEDVQKILNTVDANKIRENLRAIVSRPHMAGTEGDMQLASHIKSQWEKQGLDDVHTVPYNVLLSYADPEEPNKVELIGTNDEVLYRSTLPPLPKEDNWTGYSYPNPYMPYSPSGVVVGDPLFVNYGGQEEYQYMTETLNINTSGKIFIIRHGGGPNCVDKVHLAERHGAIGVLLYLEPETLPNGSIPDSYPHSWWLPPDGIPLCVAFVGKGDPLTPGYPSKGNLHYIPEGHADMPKIPSQPINAQDAKEILGRMGGVPAPSHWTGTLGITYNLGPKFADNFRALKLKLTVRNKLARRTIYNVFGTIRGKVEPDRYVIMGNHRDAYVKGSVDPGSGTAVMLELTRTLGKLYKEGWQPRRSLLFCSWTGEEFGLIGSMEWVEENILMLQERAVTYINVDVCVAGDTFTLAMSPTLSSAAYRIANLIPNPDNSSETLYNNWWRGMKDSGRVRPSGIINIADMMPNSDHGPFFSYAGIPGMDISFQNKIAGTMPYPVYHTIYETIYYVEKFLDPNYRRHASCTQFTGLLMKYFSDAAILPFDFEAWVNKTNYDVRSSDHMQSSDYLPKSTIDETIAALKELSMALKSWQSRVQQIDKQNPYTLRSINDHMMLMHRAFLNRVPMPDDKEAWFYQYGIDNNVFAVYNIIYGDDDGDEKQKMFAVQQHMTDLNLKLQQLTTLLNSKHYYHI